MGRVRRPFYYFPREERIGKKTPLGRKTRPTNQKNIMPTITEILRQQRTLIRENAGLKLLSLPNNRSNREWLITVLPFELAALPRQCRLYRHRDVKQLGERLRHVAAQLPPQ